MTSRAELIEIARTWVDVPFVRSGMSRSGVDCGTLIRCVMKEVGIVIPEEPPLYTLHEVRRLLPYFARNFNHGDPNKIKLGSILQFTWNGRPQHHGLISEVKSDIIHCKLIHANIRAGRVVESDVGPEYRDKFTAVYEIKGLSD